MIYVSYDKYFSLGPFYETCIDASLAIQKIQLKITVDAPKYFHFRKISRIFSHCVHERNLKLLASKLSFIEYARCYAWEFVLHYWKASTETMTTMIDINRKFFRETIGYGRCISNLTTIECGEWHKKFGKNVLWWSSRRVLIFSLLRSTLIRVQGFSKQQSFHGNKSTTPMIMDSQQKLHVLWFYSWLVFLRVGPFLFQEFYICTYE